MFSYKKIPFFGLLKKIINLRSHDYSAKSTVATANVRPGDILHLYCCNMSLNASLVVMAAVVVI